MKSQISVLLRAKNPCIWVVSHEEQRTNGILKEISKSQQKPLYIWSCVKGYVRPDKNSEPESAYDIPGAIDLFLAEKDVTGGQTSGILVLYDGHPYLKDPVVIRRIKECADELWINPDVRKNVVFISPICDIPDELGFIPVVDQPLPTRDEIRDIVKAAYAGIENFARITGYAQNEGVETLPGALAGLTVNQIVSLLSQGAIKGKIDSNLLCSEKKQLIRKSGLLEYFDTSEYSIDDVGGLDIMKNEIKKYAKRFSKKAAEYGLTPPKGVILIGPPGTGKSLSVKAIAHQLNLPLLKLSMSKISSKYYGETTQKIRSMCDLAAAISPCILWIDEIEKALGTGVEAHEETMRAIAEFLTFMEETRDSIFFVGTCNDYRSLRPELMQRFERTFLIDLPNTTEREEIFSIHISAIGRDPKNFNIPALAARSAGFVGREIKTMIREGLSSAFDRDEEIGTVHIMNELARTTPTSIQRKSEIDSMRSWAKHNCTRASSEESPVQTDEHKNVFLE